MLTFYRNPTPSPRPIEEEDLLQDIIWPKVTPDAFSFVNIGDYENTDLTIVAGKPKAARMAFWDNLYATYGNQPFESY